MKKIKYSIAVIFIAASTFSVMGCHSSDELSHSVTPSSYSLDEPNQSLTILDVVRLLSALNDQSTLDEVQAARKAYDSLSSSDKQLIAQFLLKNLTDQEHRIQSQANIAYVISLIESLSDDPSKEELSIAREAYENLSDEEKSFVHNFDVLYVDEVVRDRKDKASNFELKIDNLPMDASAKVISDLVNEYNAFEDEVKAYISKSAIDKLNALYNSKKEVIDASQNVILAIYALTDYSTKDDVEEVRKLYNELTTEAKELISETDLAILEACEIRVIAMSEAASIIVNKIALLGDDSEFTDLKALTNLNEMKEKINVINVLIDEFVKTYGENNLHDLVNNLSRMDILNRYCKTFVAYGNGDTDGFGVEGCDPGYSFPETIASEVDPVYGKLSTCSLYTANRVIEMRINNDARLTDFTGYDYYFFYFYNPTAVTFPLTLSSGSNWSGKIYQKTIVPGWNKIEIAPSYVNNLRFLTTASPTFTSISDVSGTWKMTLIYGSSNTADAYSYTNEVEQRIDSLTNTSLENEIVDIRNKYESLTEEQKGFIDNLNKLVEQENRIRLEKLVQRAESINLLIENLPTFSQTEESFVCCLSKMVKLEEELNSFINDYGVEAIDLYIPHYEKYENLKASCSGYELVYGSHSTDGFSSEGCDPGYCYPNIMNKESDGDYGDIFTTELTSGNNILEFKIANDVHLDNFEKFNRYYFYFYNPTQETFNMSFMKQNNWAGLVFNQSIVPGWNKIEFDKSRSMLLRFMNSTSSARLSSTEGVWKMSMIIGELKK